MEKPKISVIIPVWKPDFNQLRKCLDSVVNQTYDKLEVLVMYRNSVGHDKEFFSIIEKYDDERLKVISSKATSFVSTLNEGILNSSGELIARIDADDYCDVQRFEKQIEFKEKNQLNIVGSWAYWISNEGKIIGKICFPVTHSEIRNKMMFHNPMLHPTLLMEKKMLIDVGLYDTTFIHAEDYELCFRLMYHGYKFGNVPLYLGYIRDAPDSRSRGSEWRKQRSYNMKVRSKAFHEFGFNNPQDIIYYMITPISYFMTPGLWLKFKKFAGWTKL